MEELVIVGGGVAGLSCLNALLDKHRSPLLLEAGSIGSPKMCGEFIAPPAVRQLERWGIDSMPAVNQIQFLGTHGAYHVRLHQPAAAYARDCVERELASRARNNGGRIAEHAMIQTITPATLSEPYVLHLVSGEVIRANEVIFATGKFSHSQHSARVKYVGFKTHIQHVFETNTLMMLSLVEGYLGLVPISAKESNLTGLMRYDQMIKWGGRSALLHALLRESPLKKYAHSLDVDNMVWLEGDAPTFGRRSLPNWPRAYWIGDALASVHPAIGYGFSHSVISALSAVECYLQGDPASYHQRMQQRLSSVLQISKIMHHVLQKPRLCRAISTCDGMSHCITDRILRKLDY